jgi:short-subunit dehydrogenase
VLSAHPSYRIPPQEYLHETRIATVIVVTGASSGIGKATALRFARNGDTLVLAARRKNLLKELVEEVEEHGAEAIAVETDVADNGSVKKLANTAVKRFGRIDIWINDAGVGAFGHFHEVPLEDHDRVLDTNLRGTLYGSYEAIKQFRQQEYGTLINICSVLGKVTQPFMTSYAASKHGVRALSGCIRQELWLDDLDDIHVCTVFPESVDTPFFRNEANYSGYEVKPTPPIETPEHAAEVIFNLGEDPQDEVHVGKMGKWISEQQKVARGATEKQMAWMIDRKHFDRSKPERPNSGAIHEADESPRGSIRGGWKSESSKGRSWEEEGERSGAAKPLKIAGIAALGIFFLIKSRRKSPDLRAAA